MKNPKLDIARDILLENGFTVPDTVILQLLKETKNVTAYKYEPGDYVEFYAGMGEMEFGTVTAAVPNGYRINSQFGYSTFSSYSDMRGLSTPEKAAEYERERNRKPGE